MKHWILSASVGILLATAGYADIPSVWKDVNNPLVGIHLQVKREWQEVEIQETKETGTLAFNLTPHTTLSIVRQRWDQSFEVWTSSAILTQIFKPGYKISRSELAGRASVRVTGQALDGRDQESYYSNRAPFVDEISFTAPPDEWVTQRDAIDAVKKTMHWSR